MAVGAEKPVKAADGEAQAVVDVGVGADVGVAVVVVELVWVELVAVELVAVELVAVELVGVELVGVELFGVGGSAAKPGKSSCRH